MTVSDQQTETWKPVPGAAYYEVSDLGHVRSIDRTIGGRFYRGVVLKPREDSDGYLVVNITYDGGERKHGVSVARLVLLAHDPGGYRPGLQACHSPDAPDGSGGQKDNRLVKLRWDTDDANREEALAVRLVNHPPKPKPVKVCPRCGTEHAGKGQNCHECVVKLGVDGALLLAAGVSLQEAGDRLRYPPVALHNLAVKYGGLQHVIGRHLGVSMTSGEGKSAAAAITVRELAAGHVPSRQPWLRSVLIRWKAWLADSDTE